MKKKPPQQILFSEQVPTDCYIKDFLVHFPMLYTLTFHDAADYERWKANPRGWKLIHETKEQASASAIR